MKRIRSISLACTALLMLIAAGTARATPDVNGATIETRTFNDCGLSTLSTTNNYPTSISITDVMDPLCVGFANLHSFSFSADGGATPAVFNNVANYTFGADVNISGDGQGEGGLRISPWYGQFVDGRFMANVTTGEIACFGGALPFYSFTGNHALSYVRGTTIRFEATYRDNDLDSAQPATIQYRVIYNGNTYDSPVLAFGSQNLAECDPHGLWGELNDARVGGYFQPRANSGEDLTITWSNITYQKLPSTGTPCADAATIETRTFNDCALSTLTVNNDYPSSITITDVMDPLCVGFANLHSFSFSADGGSTAADFDNNANFKFGADVNISGDGQGEGGLRLSPWYGQFVDGRFMANVTSGEIACFGGALPFYSFTGNHGITYVRGTTIRFEIVYHGNENIEANPATIQYRAIYNGNTYDSPVLPFGKQNENECEHGLWGNLNDGRSGGYFQPRANTGEDLTITWSNIAFACCFNEVQIALHPRVLNSRSSGQYVSVDITPPPPQSAEDIDVSSLRLNGVPVADGAPVNVHGNTLTVKFDREAVQATLGDDGLASATLTGTIDGECLVGTSTIRVHASSMATPAAGSVLQSGSEVELAWEPADGVQSVSILSSVDNGMSWQLEADNVSNSGQYRWTVPTVVSTDQARVAIVQILTSDETGFVNEAEFAASGAFTISSALGVGGGNVSFALRGITPNPARGAFSVAFALPSSKPATLAVFDVSGRQVASRTVGGLGAGLHSVSFGQGLRPGLYLVRLTQAGQVLNGRVAVIQ
jgi:hypothetical protein